MHWRALNARLPVVWHQMWLLWRNSCYTGMWQRNNEPLLRSALRHYWRNASKTQTETDFRRFSTLLWSISCPAPICFCDAETCDFPSTINIILTTTNNVNLMTLIIMMMIYFWIEILSWQCLLPILFNSLFLHVFFLLSPLSFSLCIW